MTTQASSRLPNDNPFARRRFAGAPLAALLALGAALLTSVGCADDFDPPSLVTRTRVIGARVEVTGAPERATPAPGEEATVTWLVTAPGAVPALGWAFVLCPADPLGGLGCGGAPVAKAQGTTSPPRLTFTAPATGGASSTRFTVFGHICVAAAATVDGNGLPTGCEGDVPGATPSPEQAAKETTVSASVWVADAANANRNPVANGELTFDGASWAADSGADPCVAGPRVPVGSKKHDVTLAVVEADREMYSALRGDPPVPTALRETLEISLFATGGKMKTPFLFVEGEDPAVAPLATTTWDAPTEEALAPGGGDTPVDFTFVVRDGRGGTTSLTRSLCVTR
jgi:hypothetical protein